MKIKTIIFMSAAIMFASCGGNENSTNEGSTILSGSIEIDGSSTVFLLTEAVAEEFRMEQSEVKVTIGSSGTGSGFKKFSRGEIDIAGASRGIKDKEISACEEGGVSYLEIRVALDGLAIIVNKDNSWIDDITTEELKRLWEPNSKVNMWSDLRPEWPNEKIALYGPNTAHGTYDFFTESIVGESGASRSDYNAVSDYNVGIQGVSSDKNALGYFPLAYYTENKDRLKLIGVDNGTGVVYPSLATVGDGTYTPLARPLFIYLNEKALAREEVKTFVTFYLNNAGELAEDVGYIALPQEEYDNGLNQINAE